jgi:ABC-type amino acid transport substrate-binding protein
MAKQEGVNLVRLKDISFGIIALQAGTADAFVCSKSVLRSIFDKKNNAEQFAVLSLYGTGEDCAFAAKKDNKRLVHEINQALGLMHKNGTLEQLKNKWNL